MYRSSSTYGPTHFGGGFMNNDSVSKNLRSLTESKAIYDRVNLEELALNLKRRVSDDRDSEKNAYTLEELHNTFSFSYRLLSKVLPLLKGKGEVKIYRDANTSANTPDKVYIEFYKK